MSKGPGAIEKRIAELIAATRDRGLSVAEMADHAFQLAGQPALRAQRLSATRAGHRLLRRMREAEQKRLQLISDAKAAVGEPSTREYPPNLAAYKAAQKVYNRAVARYDAALKATEPWRLAEKLDAYVDQFGSWVRSSSMGDLPASDEREYWRVTADRSGTLYFHPPDVPIRVWAVSIQRAGVVWAEADVGRITKRNVSVRYAGAITRLDREKLWEHWALWHGVYFVSSRSGCATQRFEEFWQEEYGHAYDRQQHDADQA
jgi:hypothetical protein